MHPLSVFINHIPQFWLTIRGVWPLLLVIFVSGSSTGTEVFDLTLLLIIISLAVVRVLLHYLTCRYRYNNGKLEIKTGLIYRHARSLDAHRIQNIELLQHLSHRIFSLVEFRFESAGDTSTHGLLSAISREDADRLRGQILDAQQRYQQRKYKQKNNPNTSKTSDVEQIGAFEKALREEQNTSFQNITRLKL